MGPCVPAAPGPRIRKRTPQVMFVDPMSTNQTQMVVELPQYSTFQELCREVVRLQHCEQPELLVYTVQSHVPSEVLTVLRDRPNPRIQYQLQPLPPGAGDAWAHSDWFAVCVASSLERVYSAPDWPPFLWCIDRSCGCWGDWGDWG